MIEAKAREIGMALCTGASGEVVHLLERCALDNLTALSTLLLGSSSSSTASSSKATAPAASDPSSSSAAE